VAKEAATGRTFSFKVTDNNLLRSLKAGQAVYANFGSKQVSVNGVAPCCGIVGGPA
jgi:Cu/Ag efflux protein CusF